MCTNACECIYVRVGRGASNWCLTVLRCGDTALLCRLGDTDDPVDGVDGLDGFAERCGETFDAGFACDRKIKER